MNAVIEIFSLLCLFGVLVVLPAYLALKVFQFLTGGGSL